MIKSKFNLIKRLVKSANYNNEEKVKINSRVDLNGLVNLYSNYPIAPLSYATVRDYSDSFDHFGELATLNKDLKDVQRPWIVKAIISSIPRGGRLLEIGGGEPFVADILTQLGYKVTIVDPYDGCGNGPLDYENFKSNFPNIDIIRKYFTDYLTELEPKSFDCIYSISVLEHVPIPDLPRVCAGIKKFLDGESSKTIHAIDHVLKGAGDSHHLERLFVLADGLGFDKDELISLFEQLSGDVEAYFLSAEAHNMWRGSLKYDDFPMRKVVSLQLVL